MQHVRPTPFDLVFETAARSTFAEIREALTQARHDPRERDAFLMLREVVSLLRELRPDEGLGEGIDQLAALVHHSYLFWAAGGPIQEVTSAQLSALLDPASPADKAGAELPAFYTQLPERRVWAQVVPGEAHEPLDGYFQYTDSDSDILRVLGVFGVHPDRPGYSVVEVTGPRPKRLIRSDGTGLFESTLPGGAAAGLFSLAGEEELLELGWRARGLEARSWERGAGPGSKSDSLLEAPGS
jgi:hypothetical protein